MSIDIYTFICVYVYIFIILYIYIPAGQCSNCNILKSNKRIMDIINEECIKYAKQADIRDRIEISNTSNCFMTLKDPKENFVNHPTTRLMNPAKKKEKVANRYWIKSD